MEGDITFPPYQPPFADLEHAQAGDGGGPKASNFVNGYPYDLIDDVPVSGWKPVTTSSAKGGAVYYSGARFPGSYPTIDRAYYYRVDSAEVITQSFWGQSIDVYFQTLVKSTESSIWGYASDHNYKIKADATQVKYELWNDNGDYFSTVVKSNESSFLGNSNSGYNYKTIADSSKASIEAWGDSRFIIISTEDLSDPNHSTAKFQKIFDGAMKETYALCTVPNGTPACDELGDPIVKDIYASNLYSHKPCTNNSDTYLSLENSYFQVKAGGAADKISIDTVNIWAVTSGTTSAKFSASAIAAYDGGDNTVMDATGVTATSGSDTGNLNAQELWMTMGGVGVTKVMGSEIRISKDNGGLCVIDPPANKTCSFRQAKVCVDGVEKTAYILMSEPE
jgi:hypothetical protein